MKFDIDILKGYEKERWIYSHYHKELPLIIWNYSQFTQYEGKWNEITLNCRGLVTDLEGNLVSKGFSKFFNYSENKTQIPKEIEYVEIWEKVDGSYVGLFYYLDQWIINSKGSFYSEQVTWAKEILDNLDLNKLNKNWTYCFELVVPENRIVCNYGEEKSLYFLSAFCKGEEIDDIYPKELQETIIKFPNLIQLNTFNPEKLQKENRDNEEGYVVKFSNGERCKIKFEEYMRLHRIVTNTTSYDIWDHLRQEKPFDEILDRIPDEFYNWVKDVKQELEDKFNKKLQEIEDEFWQIIDKKYYAYRAKQSKNQSYLFTRLNSYSDNLKQAIWREIKPEFKKPFKNES